MIETIAPDFSKRLYIGEVHFSTENWEECSERENQIQNKNEDLWSLKDDEKVLESFKIFAQVNSRVKTINDAVP